MKLCPFYFWIEMSEYFVDVMMCQIEWDFLQIICGAVNGRKK